MQRSVNIGIVDYKNNTAPSTPTQGQVWEQTDNSGNFVSSWCWNGNNWINNNISQMNLNLGSGQLIAIGGIIGLVTTDTTDTLFSIGNQYNFHLIKLTVSFTTSGTLSGSNYWRLLFKNNGSTAQTLNITSGNNSEVTGNIVKTSNDINIIYNSTNRYALNLNKIGLAPNINNPTVTIEYRLTI